MAPPPSIPPSLPVPVRCWRAMHGCGLSASFARRLADVCRKPMLLQPPPPAARPRTGMPVDHCHGRDRRDRRGQRAFASCPRRAPCAARTGGAPGHSARGRGGCARAALPPSGAPAAAAPGAGAVSQPCRRTTRALHSVARAHARTRARPYVRRGGLPGRLLRNLPCRAPASPPQRLLISSRDRLRNGAQAGGRISPTAKKRGATALGDSGWRSGAPLGLLVGLAGGRRCRGALAIRIDRSVPYSGPGRGGAGGARRPSSLTSRAGCSERTASATPGPGRLYVPRP